MAAFDGRHSRSLAPAMSVLIEDSRSEITETDEALYPATIAVPIDIVPSRLKTKDLKGKGKAALPDNLIVVPSSTSPSSPDSRRDWHSLQPAMLAHSAGGLVPVGPDLVVESSLDEAGDFLTSPSHSAAPTLCIFVVRFDAKHGNMVEWVYPEEADVSGVEFSCLPSGAHNIHEDAMCVSIEMRKDRSFVLIRYVLEPHCMLLHRQIY